MFSCKWFSLVKHHEMRHTQLSKPLCLEVPDAGLALLLHVGHVFNPSLCLSLPGSVINN